MDDASRFIVAYRVYQEATAENAIQVLKQAVARYGYRGETLTERGTQFYASEGERKQKDVGQFEQYLAENGIKHILARINHPRPTGSWNDSTGFSKTSGVEANSEPSLDTSTGTTRSNHT